MTYTPGATQRLNVTVSDPIAARWAFQLTARLASNLSTGQGGAFAAVGQTQVVTSAGVQFIQNTSGGTQQGVRNAATFQVDWTAPATNLGNVVFYVVGMAASGSGTGGDRVYSANYAVTPSAPPPPPSPTLSVAPSSLSFSYQAGGVAPPAQNLSVTSSGAALNFTVSASSSGWLSVNPASGTTARTVAVSVNPAGLAAGSYSGSVSIASSGAQGSPRTIPVTLTVIAAPTLTVSPASLSFAYQTGGATPAAQNLSVTSSGAALNFTASASSSGWLSVSPASGTTPRTVAISVNPTGLAAGSYNGSVSIASSGAQGSPRTIPVTLTVGTSPALTVNPATLAFTYQTGGAAPAAQNVAVASSGTALNFTASASSSGWLSVSPASGTTPRTVAIGVNPAGLAAGSYSGSVSIASSGAQASPLTIPVTLTVSTAPTLTVNPATLTFTCQTGGGAPASQNVAVASSGAALNFTASASSSGWLSVSPASGTTAGTLAVSVNTAGLAAGSYSGSVSVASSGAQGSPRTIPVTLTITADTTPTLTVNPSTLSFAFQTGGAAPAAQTVSTTSTGAALGFTVTASGGTWLAATPDDGRTPEVVSVSVNPAGLNAGTYNGTVTIAAAGASNGPQTVAVTMTVSAPPPAVDSTQFRFNVIRAEKTRPGEYPRITFSVTDPTNDNKPYDIKTHPAFTSTANGASRIFVQLGWSTSEYTNTGSGSELAASGAAAAQPIAIDALATSVPAENGTFMVTSTRPIPTFARGSGVAALEGHPAGQDAAGALTVRLPVKSVFKAFLIGSGRDGNDDRIENRRRVVDNKKCLSCHGTLSLHGNNRTDEVQVCVICHNPNATDIPYRVLGDPGETSIDFKVMVHSIHAAQMRSTAYVVIGRSHSVNDFSAVQFPGNLKNCMTCHREGTFSLPMKSNLGTTVNTQSITTATKPIVNNDPADDLKITPATATCSSCHDTPSARDHMVRSGGSFGALQQSINSGAQKEKCNDCHGSGKSRDVSRVH